MDAIWKKTPSQRQNPYLDWELKNRPFQRKAEDWCSVHIQVVPSDGGDYVPNLRRLAESVAVGKQDDDASGDDALTITMAGDEQAHLEELLKDIDTNRIKPPTDPVEFQFFIYRPESLAHQQFNSGAVDVYHIINVGPPIIGLGFKPARGAPEPTSFDRDLAAGTGHVAI